MKLKQGDRIKYNGSIFKVGAVLWSAVYLQPENDSTDKYDYDMKEVYEYYKDIEFLH